MALARQIRQEGANAAQNWKTCFKCLKSSAPALPPRNKWHALWNQFYRSQICQSFLWKPVECMVKSTITKRKFWEQIFQRGWPEKVSIPYLDTRSPHCTTYVSWIWGNDDTIFQSSRSSFFWARGGEVKAKTEKYNFLYNPLNLIHINWVTKVTFWKW